MHQYTPSESTVTAYYLTTRADSTGHSKGCQTIITVRILYTLLCIFHLVKTGPSFRCVSASSCTNSASTMRLHCRDTGWAWDTNVIYETYPLIFNQTRGRQCIPVNSVVTGLSGLCAVVTGLSHPGVCASHIFLSCMVGFTPGPACGLSNCTEKFSSRHGFEWH
ncbi:hypothetical protein BC629DRAFT_889521 [Irpex lacteus]|nr:hypothetical protein BC629DRAFT_889521 [Irpex lacteus]